MLGFLCAAMFPVIEYAGRLRLFRTLRAPLGYLCGIGLVWLSLVLLGVRLGDVQAASNPIDPAPLPEVVRRHLDFHLGSSLPSF